MSVGTSRAAEEIARAIPDGPHRMQVGLRPQPLSAWIPGQADFATQLAQRQRLIDSRDDVLAALPGSEAATSELLALLAEHLPRTLPELYRREGSGLRVVPLARSFPVLVQPAAALATLARLVPDDLCIVEADPKGTYRLTAAAVCFPTRWRLAPKMGEPLLAIHAPVPGYAERIGAAVDRVFASLRPGRLLLRTNLSLVDSPALYQPHRGGQPRDPPAEVDDVGTHLWARSERQTVRRLPGCAAVVFTIRIRQVRLDELCRVPQAAAALRRQIETTPLALRRYKGIEPMRARLIGYLERQPAKIPI